MAERDDAVERQEIVIIFDSNDGSPYSRRQPISTFRSEPISRTHSDWTPSCGSDAESDHHEHIDMHDFALPLELHRNPSMQNLRNRRDPHYQGNRHRRAKRVIDKSGERNVGFLHIPERSRRFLRDFVTTFVEEQWRFVITVFALSFFVCWIFFAGLWYLIAYAHGDLTVDEKTGERLSDGPVSCVEGATTFAGFLLLSIETQVSIGFGEKYPNEECPEAIFLMVVQIVTGIAIEGAMVGIVYVKMVRPPRKSSDMKFSRKAVVCQRDTKLCLLFRVCDANEVHVVESRVHAYWFEERISMEGEMLRQFQHSLKLENNGRLFAIFPLTLCHIIDSNSPLYDLSAKDLLEKKFEIVVTLTGGSRSTGQLTQERTSYLPKEIMWGHRFPNIVEYDRKNAVYVADYDRFDSTEPVDTPLCSAKRLDEVIVEIQNFSDKFPTKDADFDKSQPILMSNNSVADLSSAGEEEEDDGPIRIRHAASLNQLAVELEQRLSQISLNRRMMGAGRESYV